MAGGRRGGLTAEVTTDNSTADRRAVTGAVINPSRSLHYTIDEGEGDSNLLSLARFIFYHNKTLARRVAHRQDGMHHSELHPAGPLRERDPLQCPACGMVFPSPSRIRAVWVHHFDAAVDRARGVGWTCGCGRPPPAHRHMSS